jgi:hypothetical protein
MLRLFLTLLTLIPVAAWELHAVTYAPWWAQAMPIWPWFVTALCLEMERRRVLAAWIGVATWSVLLTGRASLALFSTSIVLVVAHVLLKVWVSHRSMWGALALVWIGRALLSIAEAVQYWWQDAWQMVDWSLYWHHVLGRFVWDALFVMIGLRCALWLRKRLQPYISLTSRPL